MSYPPAPPAEPIAIIGTAHRFAGDSSTPAKLWSLMQDPSDLVLPPLPSARQADDDFPSLLRGPYLVAQDPGAFDAGFFHIHPAEARAMDPQHRLLLEVSFEALDAAGLAMEQLRGRSDTAVYVGLMFSDYENLAMRSGDVQSLPTYHSTGTYRSMAAARVAHSFDWRGPAMTVDTACSSSLVAVDLAVQALRRGEARVAMAAGTNLILGGSPEVYVAEGKLGMLSKEGRCRMWDSDADGYARGEGVAVLVLKTLRQALEDGDDVECVIRETGVNQDGRGNGGGITVPSADAQARLIRQTYARAGLDATKAEDRCQFFEAHGTGTPTGDPIEAEAIHRAFFGELVDHDPHDSHAYEHEPPKLHVGSVKTVLGHTEACAGIAGVLRASLALQKARIPPNLHFAELSPRVAPWYRHLEVPVTAVPWPSSNGTGTRRASVNSFGFGGTNAHAILESYESHRLEGHNPHLQVQDTPFGPFILAATSAASLREKVASCAAFLAVTTSTKSTASNLAWTLSRRTCALEYRTWFRASSLSTLQDALVKFQTGSSDSDQASSSVTVQPLTLNHSPRLLAVFTGQGAQYARMAASLVEQSLWARRIVRQLEAHLAALPDPPAWSLERELLLDRDLALRADETVLAQTLSTAVQILLARLLRELAGVDFAAVVGHSSGEIAAAWAAGCLSEADAMAVAYYRGLACGHSRSGGGREGRMMAVAMSMAEARELCRSPPFESRLVVAASNSPSSTTLSGDADAVDEAELLLKQRGVWCRRLQVRTAYHSHHMQPFAAPYTAFLRAAGVTVLQPPAGSPLWISSTYDEKDEEKESGGRIVPPLASIEYWAENLTRPVLFSQALRKVLTSTSCDAPDLVVELGPHPALKLPASETMDEVLARRLPYTWLLHRQDTDSKAAVSHALGFLWAHGVSIDLVKYQRCISGSGTPPSIIKDLPTYPWDHRTRYWHNPQAVGPRHQQQPHGQQQQLHPLLGFEVLLEPYGVTASPHHHHGRAWRNRLRLDDDHDDDSTTVAGLGLQHHRLQGRAVFPAAGYLLCALEAAVATVDGLTSATGATTTFISHIDIVDFEILHPLVFEERDRDLAVDDLDLEAQNRDNDPRGTETLVSIGSLRPLLDSDSASNSAVTHTQQVEWAADFAFSAGLGRPSTKSAASLTLMATAKVRIVLSDKDQVMATASPDPNPIRRAQMAPALGLAEVRADSFYAAVSALGYQYTGPFRSLGGLYRKLGRASGSVHVQAPLDTKTETGSTNAATWQPQAPTLLTHPAVLDGAMQSLLLAYSYPHDGRLASLHVPAAIARVRVNNPRALKGHETLTFDALAWDAHGGAGGKAQPRVCGNVDMVAGDGTTAIQMQGVRLVPLGGPVAADGDMDEDGVTMYWCMRWDRLGPLPSLRLGHQPLDQQDFFHVLERTAVFVARRLDQRFPHDHPARTRKPFCYYLASCTRMATCRRLQQWHKDEINDITRASAPYASSPELRWIHLVNDHMPAVLANTTGAQAAEDAQDDNNNKNNSALLEHLRPSGLLDTYYTESRAFPVFNRWLARQIAHVAHQHQHMRLLEVGAGTGAATRLIIDALRDAARGLASYTFTDVSPAFFEPARAMFNGQQADNVVFQTLDAERDPEGQGFRPAQYDVVVASHVLHATRSLEATLRHVRRLLRPGGWLAMAEITDTARAWPALTFGALPGWWAGVDDGRTTSPCISIAEWDHVLRRTGFARVETTPREWETMYACSAFLARAVDDDAGGRVAALLDPLAGIAARWPAQDELVVIGRAGRPFVQRVVRLLASSLPESTPIRIVTGLEDVDHTVLSASLVVSLIDVGTSAAGSGPEKASNGSVFRNLTQARLDGLRGLFGPGSRPKQTLVWVTSGRKTADDPWSSMVVGFARAAALEAGPGLGRRVQLVDLDVEHARKEAVLEGDGPNDVDGYARTLVETALRFHTLDGDTAVTAGLLWSVEPEIVVQHQGRVLVPRLYPVKGSANDRYKAGRKIARFGWLPAESDAVVGLGHDGDGENDPTVVSTLVPFASTFPANEDEDEDDKASSGHVDLNVKCSTTRAIRTPLGPRYLIMGNAMQDNSPSASSSCASSSYLALTASLISPQRIARHDAHRVKSHESTNNHNTPANFLAVVAANMAAKAMMRGVSAGETVLVHNPPTRLFAQCTQKYASSLDVHIIFTAGTRPEAAEDEASTRTCPDADDYRVVLLNGRMSKKLIQSLVPDLCQVSHCWGLAVGEEDLRTQATICACLPTYCLVSTIESLLPARVPFEEPISSTKSAATAAANLVSQALALAQDWTDISHACPPSQTTSIHALARGDAEATRLVHEQPLALLSWDRTNNNPSVGAGATVPPLRVRIQRLDASSPGQLFSPSKTYWLVGLSQSLGLSLCEWMLAHGARHLVITSRDPHSNISAAWIHEQQQQRLPAIITITLQAADVTDRAALGAAHSAILSSGMPPVAGVLFGAMVLRDRGLADMTLADMAQVTAPRVGGSWNLHTLFDGGAHPRLDFFVLLSSVAGTLGSPGQTNYAASNTFLEALATHRRRAGLVASVVDVGLVVGAGYVTRELLSQDGGEETAARHFAGRLGLRRMSEGDVHHLVAEAIVSGREAVRKWCQAPVPALHQVAEDLECDDWDVEPAIISGLARVFVPEWHLHGHEQQVQSGGHVSRDGLPAWYTNPIFGQLITAKQKRQQSTEDGLQQGAQGMPQRERLSTQDRLAQVQTPEELHALVRGALAAKLRAVTSLPGGEDDDDDDRLMAKYTDQIGLDSLVAIDLLSWLSRTFGVRLQVLDVMGSRVAVADLVDDVVDAVPADMVPCLRDDSEPDDAAGDADTIQLHG